MIMKTKNKDVLKVFEPSVFQFVEFLKKKKYKYKVVEYLYDRIEEMLVYNYKLGSYDGIVGLAGVYNGESI